MKFANGSLKWTIIVTIFTLVLVVSGYLAGLFLQGQSEGEVLAVKDGIEEEAVGEEQDVTRIIPEVENDETEDEPKQEEIPEVKDTRLTVGATCSTQLVDEGTINILIIGEDKVSYLYDTLGIVSINKDTNTIKFIMIPRDTYIEYNKDIRNALSKAGKLNTAGIFKINYTHHIGTLIKYNGKFSSQAISFLADVIKEKFNVEVDDYVKINTEGFVELVDHFDGVDINVPYDMNYEDPSQDLYIHLEKGAQHLDGRQAEGFVRFRQGWREDGTFFEIGDTERKKNQIYFMKEFLKQHGTLKKIDKIPEMFRIMGKNVKSSIGLGDVLSRYLGLAKDLVMNKYKVESLNLDGKPIRINGSSYIDIK